MLPQDEYFRILTKSLRNNIMFFYFRVPNIVLNVDIAPTILDIGGITVPDTMDGRSVMKLFDKAQESNR